MDIGTPLIEHRAIDIAALRVATAAQPPAFWSQDRATRTMLAGDRPGDAVYYYGHEPRFAGGSSIKAVRATGALRVVRHRDRPLFDLIDRLIAEQIAPCYPACDVLRAQLAELPAGAAIAQHTDAGILSAIHRLHVPIVTNPGVRFVIDDHDFRLVEGVLYELNNVVPHAVYNDGDAARIHLLIDMLPHMLGRTIHFDTKAALLHAALHAA